MLGWLPFGETVRRVNAHAATGMPVNRSIVTALSRPGTRLPLINMDAKPLVRPSSSAISVRLRLRRTFHSASCLPPDFMGRIVDR